MSPESKRLKKSSSWLNSGNALHLSENAIFVFPHFPAIEAQVIQGGKVKHPLNAYFIDNISAKKISKSKIGSRVSKL